MTQGFKKAKIIAVGNKGKKIAEADVLFNPNQYTVESGNKFQYSIIPGLSNKIAHFISGDSEKLTMDLYFNTYEKRSDVRKETKKITDLIKVEKDFHAPPLCIFLWSSFAFRGVIEHITQKYTMFLENGTPVRAELTVTFRQVMGVKEQLKKTPRQSADRTKKRTLKQGDQLWMIAHDEYEDPGKWREIAKANGIDNPRYNQTGNTLTVPRLE